MIFTEDEAAAGIKLLSVPERVENRRNSALSGIFVLDYPICLCYNLKLRRYVCAKRVIALLFARKNGKKEAYRCSRS